MRGRPQRRFNHLPILFYLRHPRHPRLSYVKYLQQNIMADLTSNFAGIKSPNPFWLASAPPTNMGSMIERAFDAGWGGAVWKTLGEPITNVSSRLAALDQGPLRMIGLNNIELITDRSLEINLKEMAECKKKYPNH